MGIRLLAPCDLDFLFIALPCIPETSSAICSKPLPIAVELTIPLSPGLKDVTR